MKQHGWNYEKVYGNCWRYKIRDYDDISPKAQDKIADKSTIGKGDYTLTNDYRSYPFIRMKIGQAFYVMANEACRQTLEACHKNFTKSHEGRYFRVIWHKDHQCFEIVRIK